MTRDSFVFYRSFFESAQMMNKSERLRFYDMLAAYALNGVEPSEVKGASGVAFLSSRPSIDANNRKYENGSKGGRPKKNQTETKPKPNHNQTITKPKPYEDEDEDGDVYEDVHEDEDGSSFVLADGSAYFPPAEKVQEFSKAFPDVDVKRELLRCVMKHNAMDRRKNVTNIERYIVNWLINAQNDARKKPGFTDMEKRETKVDDKFWKELAGRSGNLI